MDKNNSQKLPEGKLPIRFLESILSSLARGENVVSPSIGVDVGVVKIGNKYLVMSSDPITGTVSNMPWHAVHVSANDVATSGIMPRCLSLVSLFPPHTRPKEISSFMKETSAAAKSIGITISGGHTEITPGLERPIVVVTCFGWGSNYVTSAMARENDSILMTKTAGIEGTSILANLSKVKRSLGEKTSAKALKIIKQLSIVEDARLAFRTKRVHAMHDTTEGGTIGAIAEMSVASNLGFELEAEKVPVDLATSKICALLKIDPLKLIGSGSLIIACSESDEEKVIRSVSSKRILCTKIGKFTNVRGGRMIMKNGRVHRLATLSIQDELWPVLGKYGNLS
ncbi:MAG: AIR synthase family protein [Nitrososphaerales archaeon]